MACPRMGWMSVLRSLKRVRGSPGRQRGPRCHALHLEAERRAAGLGRARRSADRVITRQTLDGKSDWRPAFGSVLCARPRGACARRFGSAPTVARLLGSYMRHLEVMASVSGGGEGEGKPRAVREAVREYKGRDGLSAISRHRRLLRHRAPRFPRAPAFPRTHLAFPAPCTRTSHRTPDASPK